MTGTPPDVRKYFYWSDRRVNQIASHGDINLHRSGSVKMKSPNGPFLPGVEVDRPRRPLSRSETAAIIERYLDGVTVRDFVTPPPVRFAAGCGTLTFAEFMNHGRIEDTVSIFTTCVATDGTRVAIGMFGSKDNLADVISSTPTSRNGWSSSAAGQIFEFISSFGGGPAGPLADREYIAREALNLLAHQGGKLGEGRKRGFTYGHIGDFGEWLLEACLDIDLRDRPFEADMGAIDRVILGAPLWVRTPRPKALVLYHSPDSSSHRPLPDSGKVSWWRRKFGGRIE